ncbi:hypothetical protein BEH94_12070 [Candidatus Altiarchaeales archaeon WOR_SM1_SCG]|nr:hypothetical protein BEH94_12070 [Candidatus Altiarchaeales archaeon WOR_SM1_SCG]
MARLTNKTEEEVWDTDFSDLKIDEHARELTKCLANRFRGGVRISTGRFYTEEEWENKRNKVLSTPLP